MAVMAMVVALGPALAGAAGYTDPKFVARTVATGLTKPVGAAWGPAGRPSTCWRRAAAPSRLRLAAAS